MHSKHHQRLKEIEFVVFKKRGEENNVFTDIFKRFIRVETETKERDQDLSARIKAINESTMDFRFLVETVEEALKKAQNQMDKF